MEALIHTSAQGRTRNRHLQCKLGCPRFFLNEEGMLHHIVDFHLKMDRKWVVNTLASSNIPDNKLRTR